MRARRSCVCVLAVIQGVMASMRMVGKKNTTREPVNSKRLLACNAAMRSLSSKYRIIITAVGPNFFITSDRIINTYISKNSKRRSNWTMPFGGGD